MFNWRSSTRDGVQTVNDNVTESIKLCEAVDKANSSLFLTGCRWQIIYTRFIRLAANPAPKPLSILTTVTPAAQELSIPNKAESPLKLAP